MTTTISLSKETKAEFDNARPENADSADEFIQMLLESWKGENSPDRKQTIDVEDARLLAQHVERTVAPYFEDMESATKEATNAAQSADRKLDNMGGR